jgi:hypothetical protein
MEAEAPACSAAAHRQGAACQWGEAPACWAGVHTLEVAHPLMEAEAPAYSAAAHRQGAVHPSTEEAEPACLAEAHTLAVCPSREAGAACRRYPEAERRHLQREGEAVGTHCCSAEAAQTHHHSVAAAQSCLSEAEEAAGCRTHRRVEVEAACCRSHPGEAEEAVGCQTHRRVEAEEVHCQSHPGEEEVAGCCHSTPGSTQCLGEAAVSTLDTSEAEARSRRAADRCRWEAGSPKAARSPSAGR